MEIWRLIEEKEMRDEDGREIKGGVEERNKARMVDAGVRRTALETPMRRVRESRKKSEAERKRETQERERERENKIERKEFTTRK